MMKCTACSKELTRKEALYTEDRLPYCPNPFTCNEEHPNSTKNILARQGAIKMFTEDDLETNIFDSLNVTEEMKDRITKVATKPQSIRLSKVDIAYYLIQMQEKKGFNSLSECIRYCVTLAMQYEPVDAAMENLPLPTPEPDPEPKPEPPSPEFKEELFVDARDPITNPEPVEEKEEDFVF